MNLETRYLGLKLRSPLIVGASPFSDDPHVARQLEDSGAGAIVMRSLFEEKIQAEQQALTHFIELGADSHSEAMTYFPNFPEYQLAMDQYLGELAQLKRTLSIPVIASLNGYRPGAWTDFAARCEAVGADAIELNLYLLATDPNLDASQVEAGMLETVGQVVRSVRIPVAVKLSPFHTSPVQFVLALDRVGAAGVVLFNRFYQPDFNIEELEAEPRLILSNSTELLLRLRWLSIISPRIKGSLSATGGAHTMPDIVKALLAGAHTVQLVSVLLKNGPSYLSTLHDSLRRWMEDHHYESIDEFRGAMNLSRCPDPSALERANYQAILRSWRV